jgi:hypothetical protein
MASLCLFACMKEPAVVPAVAANPAAAAMVVNVGIVIMI